MSEIKQERFTLEQAAARLSTDTNGIEVLVAERYLVPLDQRIINSINHVKNIYTSLSSERITEDAKSFVRKQFPNSKWISTFGLSELDKAKASFMDYNSALNVIIGFSCTEEEIKQYNPEIFENIQKSLNPIVVKGNQVYLDKVVKRIHSKLSENPKYHEAIAEMITSRVTDDVVDLLKLNKNISEFCTEFGIQETRLEDYFRRRILRLGTANLVDEVLRLAKTKYDVTLTPERVKLACLKNPKLQNATKSETIANRDEFFKSLIPAEDITLALFGDFSLVTAMAQDYISANFLELPLVNYNGKVYTHKDDKNTIESRLTKGIPTRTRREYLKRDLGCNENSLRHFIGKFHCLEEGSTLDKCCVQQLKKDLEQFKTELYDGKRIASELDSIFIPSSELVSKMIQERILAQRTFNGLIHRSDAEPLMGDIRLASQHYGSFEQDILMFLEKDYGLFAHLRGIKLKDEDILRNSIDAKSAGEFGKDVYDSIKNKIFYYRDEERLFNHDAIDALNCCSDLTVKGLCAQINFLNHSNTELQKRVAYIMRQLGVKYEKSVDSSDSNIYVSREESKKVLSAFDYLASAGFTALGNDFINMASINIRSYYSKREAEILLGTRTLQIEPTIQGYFPLYSAQDLSEELRESFSSDFSAFIAKNAKSSHYEILFLAATNSRLLSRQGWVTDNAQRETDVQFTLKLGHAYSIVKDNATKLCQEFARQKKLGIY